MSEQRIIIFDSPDGTGKTNMAQALAKRMDIPYFRMPTQHDNWRKNKFKEALEFDQVYMAEFLKQTKTSVIVDRAYPSEWVYSQAYGRETNPDVLERVDSAFARLGTNIIIPLRSDYSKNRKDVVVQKDMLPVLDRLYREFAAWTHCHTVIVDPDSLGNDVDKEIPFIEKNLCFSRLVLEGRKK